MLRQSGTLVPIGWDEALGIAADKLLAAKREHGPASILHYRSGGSLGILKILSDLFFRELGPVTEKHGDICSGAGDAAQEADFGIFESHDLFDLLESKLIVMWGKNPHVSGVHLLPVLKQAQARGARIVGLDPVRTRAASLCDLFLLPKPGSDYAVAMAVARHLFETDAIDPDARSYCDHLDELRALAFAESFEGWARAADIPQADLHAFADAYAKTKPAAILVGWGMGRRRNGGRTVRAIDALAAISGNLGISGGGASFEFARRRSFDTDFGFAPKKPARTFSEACLGPEILSARDPEIRVAWITAGNPVSMLPESESVRRALERVDFTVVVDTHPTDTTDVADLVLPTLTLLEDSDVFGAYGNHWLRVSEPVIDAPQGSLHDLVIWQRLAERLGFGEVMAGSIDDWKRRAMRRLGREGVTLERLRQGAVKNPFVKRVLFEDRRSPPAPWPTSCAGTPMPSGWTTCATPSRPRSCPDSTAASPIATPTCEWRPTPWPGGSVDVSAT
jgi:anaerobic selenocysteine-containing dehydrogenase